MPDESRANWSPFGYAITILLSSFLIFQVQPLISKYILPWFGGTPGVWTACMLFFQVLLFAGYAYAHFSIHYLAPRAQFAVHAVLMCAALSLLPIAPSANWKPHGTDDPTWRILGLLAASVGLPYFILSSTGPLLQAWFSRTRRGASPYRLYALSNVGSVAGLVTYPFVVEPLWTADVQAAIWSWSFVAFALFCMLCAVAMVRAQTPHAVEVISAGADHPATAEHVPPTAGVRWLWFGLAACASVMLLATTNQVCLDVAVIPFLWVLPLTLYLVSFILCFDHERWYSRPVFLVALALSILGLLHALDKGSEASIVSQITVYFSALFVCCMVCHGELVRLKPSPRHLTSFYLSSSAGGAAGGILVGLIAPLVFHRYIELHLSVMACCLITLAVLYRDRDWFVYRGRPRWVWICLIALVAALGWHLQKLAGHRSPADLEISRNFYGVLRVYTANPKDSETAARVLVNGRIRHGQQFLADHRRRKATSYYSESSGVGLALRYYSRLGPKRFGVVGLGAGTLATYGERNDYCRFYEINPDVIRLSKQYFTYVADCPGKVDVILGDARLSMEQEQPQHFDLLALDAFSSDAIPAHLLTREAFEIYLRQIKPNGVIAVHVSNKHFNLNPVVDSLAEHFGLKTVTISSKSDDFRGESAATWMLMTRNPVIFDDPHIQSAIKRDSEPHTPVRMWTDQYINVIQVLRRKQDENWLSWFTK